MSQSKSKQIIARSYSGEGHGIQYANQEKITLGLRTLRLESEIKKAGYPTDMSAAINWGVQVRADQIENRYEQVMWFLHMKQFGTFWQDFGCKSLDEWFAKFDLPTGATLAAREIMVRLFSKETFLLVGDEVLGDMIYLVSRFQSDPEKKKADYQNIFDLYCKTNDSFDKTEFRGILNIYVNRTYAEKVVNIEDEKARPPRQLPKGTRSEKVARPTSEDFVIEHGLCAGCRARDAYIAKIQRIAKEYGLELPERPSDI